MVWLWREEEREREREREEGRRKGGGFVMMIVEEPRKVGPTAE